MCGLNYIEHGHIEYNGGLRFGTQATYTCDKGYKLEGNIARLCQRTEEINGFNWSGTIPYCYSLGEHIFILFH